MKVLRAIDAELNRANDIDFVFTNDLSVEHFHEQIDLIIEGLLSVGPTLALATSKRATNGNIL
jgi:hypothetical protein